MMLLSEPRRVQCGPLTLVQKCVVVTLSGVKKLAPVPYVYALPGGGEVIEHDIPALARRIKEVWS